MILFFCVNYISQDYYCGLYMYVSIQEKNYRKYNGEKLFLFGLKHMPYWEISHFRQKFLEKITFPKNMFLIFIFFLSMVQFSVHLFRVV